MSDQSCLFCAIAAGSIPAETVFENERVIAFRDIKPQAPVHILVIPRLHCPAIHLLDPDALSIMTDLYAAVSTVVKKEKLDQAGYRLVINAGENGGQEVPHIHIHILGGRSLSWPPG
jgi:histidine triad (HIT) family protein